MLVPTKNSCPWSFSALILIFKIISKTFYFAGILFPSVSLLYNTYTFNKRGLRQVWGSTGIAVVACWEHFVRDAVFVDDHKACRECESSSGRGLAGYAAINVEE